MKHASSISTLSVKIMILSVFLSLAACKKDQVPGNITPPADFSITGIRPNSGGYGTVVTITGTGFGAVLADDSVYFNGVGGSIISANDSQIVASVPKYAGTGNIIAKIAGALKTGPLFTYIYRVQESPYAGLQNSDPFVGSYKDGPAASAGFFYPMGLGLDQNNNLYVFDYGNGKLREITPPTSNGGSQVSTLFDLGYGGSINNGVVVIYGLAYNGSSFFVDGERVPGYPAGSPLTALIPPPNKGVGGETLFPVSNWAPTGVFMDKAGNIYATSFNKVAIIYNSGPLSWTFIGSDQYGDQDGNWLLDQENQPNPSIEPAFHYPYGIVVDSSGNIFFTDWGNNKIRKITPKGVVSTFAGDGTYADKDGTGTAASFSNPSFITIDGSGNLYVIDYQTTLRKISPAGVVSTLCAQCVYQGQGGIVIDAAGQNLYVSNYLGGTIDIYSIF
jgi:serine/threonine-protein kinase